MIFRKLSTNAPDLSQETLLAFTLSYTLTGGVLIST